MFGVPLCGTHILPTRSGIAFHLSLCTATTNSLTLPRTMQPGTSSLVIQSMRRPWYRPSLTTRIFIGLVVGAAIGYLRPDWGNDVYFLRDIFLNLIKSIIAPLVFSTLVVGIAGGGDLKKVGRMGVKALIYFEIVTTVGALHRAGRRQFHQAWHRRCPCAQQDRGDHQDHRQTHPEDAGRDNRARFSVEHHRRDGARRRFADRRVCVLFAMAVSAIGEKGEPIVGRWRVCRR